MASQAVSVFVAFVLPLLSMTLLQAETVIYVPQVVDGENPSEAQPEATGFFRTQFNVFNLSDSSSADVTIRLTTDDGMTFSRLRCSSSPACGSTPEVTFSLPPLGYKRINTTSGPYTLSGWAKITASREIGVITRLSFWSLADFSLLATASVPSEPETSAFSTEADEALGFALLNTSEAETARIDVQLYGSDGSFEDEREIVLEPLEKVAQFLTEGGLFTDLNHFLGTAEFKSSLPVVPMVIHVDDGYWSTSRILAARLNLAP